METSTRSYQHWHNRTRQPLRRKQTATKLISRFLHLTKRLSAGNPCPLRTQATLASQAARQVAWVHARPHRGELPEG